MSNPAIDLASALQSASIKRHPSPTHDINPSTAASAKQPVSPTVQPPSRPSSPYPPSSSATDSDSESTISLPPLHPVPRRKNFPPLPDLRFEQSYLASIKNARSNYDVAIITVRDQVVMPLVQGLLWSLLVVGWRHWNRGVKLKGQGVGARVRRWWWGVNGWKID